MTELFKQVVFSERFIFGTYKEEILFRQRLCKMGIHNFLVICLYIEDGGPSEGILPV